MQCVSTIIVIPNNIRTISCSLFLRIRRFLLFSDFPLPFGPSVTNHSAAELCDLGIVGGPILFNDHNTKKQQNKKQSCSKHIIQVINTRRLPSALAISLRSPRVNGVFFFGSLVTRLRNTVGALPREPSCYVCI